ncbi:hypothetical protein H0H93_001208, partial [Arthromyces matolae]
TSQALFSRPTRKKNERSLLFNGEGQVLSSDEFCRKVEEQNKRKEEEASQKARNAERREARREALAALEEEWTKIKVNHEANVKIWEQTCADLASSGVPKRSWPKKPVRPLKPKVAAGIEEPQDDNDGDDEEED